MIPAAAAKTDNNQTIGRQRIKILIPAKRRFRQTGQTDSRFRKIPAIREQIFQNQRINRGTDLCFRCALVKSDNFGTAEPQAGCAAYLLFRIHRRLFLLTQPTARSTASVLLTLSVKALRRSLTSAASGAPSTISLNSKSATAGWHSKEMPEVSAPPEMTFRRSLSPFLRTSHKTVLSEQNTRTASPARICDDVKYPVFRTSEVLSAVL